MKIFLIIQSYQTSRRKERCYIKISKRQLTQGHNDKSLRRKIYIKRLTFPLIYYRSLKLHKINLMILNLSVPGSRIV